jgi:hypothetical protein
MTTAPPDEPEPSDSAPCDREPWDGKPWDADFLQQWEDDQREQRDSAQFDEDYAFSLSVIDCVTSNNAGGWRVCPRKACRRARCCATELYVPCVVIGRRDLTPAQQNAVDEVYADLQRERMEAALAAEELPE